MTTRARADMSELETAFLTLWRQCGYPTGVWMREYKFLADRRFRFDFANLDSGVAVECDGGTWAGGRHVRGAGFARDAEKGNLAAADGWLVFHLTADMLAKDPVRWLGLIAGAMGIRAKGAGDGDIG